MKRAKKITSALMAFTMMLATAFGASACGEDSTITVIRIMNYGGGVGRVWLDEACARFAENNQETVFEEGKQGVTFKIEHNLNTGVETMKSSTYNIYFDEGTGNIASLARSGALLNIDDILTATVDGETIESKIDSSALNSLKGDDGSYYALPSATWYPGVTYDKDLFTNKNLYFAAPNEDAAKTEPFQSAITGKTYRFAKANGKRTCGINGTYDTNYDEPSNDDGLPTSLEELMVLCERMKRTNVTPFVYSGVSSHYVHYLVSSLWASLSGFDMMRTIYDFKGDVEVLTDYTTENVFSGINYFKAPVTEVKTIEEADGYYAAQNVNRYYALSFLETALKQNWFTNDATTGVGTNVDAQGDFVWSDHDGEPAIGMLIEGNYWYNESYSLNTVFEDFYLINDEVEERKVAWMPLPVQLKGSIEEGAGKGYTFLETADAYAFLNKNMENKPGLVNACKEFVKFLFSDAELSRFTGNTGIVRAHFDYELDSSDYDKLTYFQKSVYDLISSENTKIVFSSADNKTFNSNKPSLRISTAGRYMEPLIGNKKYATFINAFKDGKTAKEAFESSYIPASEWSGIYKGE